jgi:hypothetical protein
MSDAANSFAKDKFVMLPAVVQKPLLSSLLKYALKRVALGHVEFEKEAPATPVVYADPMMDMLLINLAPAVERATGLEVYPTFSYFRVYKRGDVLARHKDRPACEIGLTVNLGCEAERPWSLFIEGPNGVSALAMEPGDGVVCRGFDCPHWREAFEGEYSVQLLLFYVDRHGPLVEWKFDKRGALNSFLAPLAGTPVSSHP